MNPILRYLKKPNQISKPVSDMYDKIFLWGAMYENKAPWLNQEVSGLNLAAGIASELARLVTLEMKTEVSGDKRGEFLNEEFLSVADSARKFTEIACAKGSIILKPYVKKGHIYVDYIHPEDFMPLEFDSGGKITAAAFLDRVYHGDKVYTRVEEHWFDDKYVIRNRAYKSNNQSEPGREISLSDVPEWRGLEEYAEISGVTNPLFAHFKMPAVNTHNTDSPLGASAYSRAVELIKDADIQYSRILWEFESGKRALFVDESAITRDRLGRKIIPDTRLYRMLSTDDDTLFKDWTPNIRYREMNEGLNRILRSIEFNTGLAYGTLSDVDYSDKTAEEIRSSKQRSYANVADIQNALKKALKELLYAMDIWCSVYNLAPGGEYSVSFDFDDSIVADRAVEFSEKLKLLEMGIMKSEEFRMWYFGEDEEQARNVICEMRGRND